MIKKIRRQFEETKGKKRHRFDDFDPIVRRCFKDYAHLFPKQHVNKDGSRFVYHPNVEGLTEISLEKEHGSREFVPYYYAKLAMLRIEELISFIETHPNPEDGRHEDTDDDDPGGADQGP